MTAGNDKKNNTTKNTKKPQAVDVDSIDLERMKTMVSDAPGQSEYAVGRGGVAFTPTKEGAVRSRAFKVMDQQIAMQMDNIMEQVQVLARQAEALKKRRSISEEIYSATIKFEPVVGNLYYLYATPQGRILSMISPEDFGAKKLEENQYQFIAKAMLLADCTWQLMEGNID